MNSIFSKIRHTYIGIIKINWLLLHRAKLYFSRVTRGWKQRSEPLMRRDSLLQMESFVWHIICAGFIVRYGRIVWLIGIVCSGCISGLRVFLWALGVVIQKKEKYQKRWNIEMNILTTYRPKLRLLFTIIKFSTSTLTI